MKWRFCLALALCAALIVSARAEQRETLNDFNRADVLDRFQLARDAEIARRRVDAVAGRDGPSGQSLEVTTAGSAGVYARKGSAAYDLLNVSDVEFWVYRADTEAARRQSTIEFQFIEADGKTRFWHKVELSHRGWKKFSLPLRYFRWSDGRIPRWDRIATWGFWFRDGAQVQIDDVVLLRQDDPDSALLQPADYRALAFPDSKEADVRILERDRLLLATNARALDLEKLAAHLALVDRQLHDDFPHLDDAPWPATLLVFETREQFQAFTPRFAQRMQSEAAPPRSGGYTVRGISTSYWDETLGTLRPVYTHEFIHSALARGMGLQNKNEWLQEGLATHYQLRFHPQKNFNAIVREGIVRAEFHSPLAELTSGKPIPSDRYWQAATLVEMLMRSEKYRDRFHDLVGAFAERGSTDLGACREAVLGVSWEELTADWKTFCADRYGR